MADFPRMFAYPPVQWNELALADESKKEAEAKN